MALYTTKKCHEDYDVDNDDDDVDDGDDDMMTSMALVIMMMMMVTGELLCSGHKFDD